MDGDSFVLGSAEGARLFFSEPTAESFVAILRADGLEASSRVKDFGEGVVWFFEELANMKPARLREQRLEWEAIEGELKLDAWLPDPYGTELVSVEVELSGSPWTVNCPVTVPTESLDSVAGEVRGFFASVAG